ncbi:MAG: glycosyltransferase family 2 protein [Nanoarchaeota archaeon]
MKPKISLVIPIHNEEKIVEKIILDIDKKMKGVFGNSFEIICSENGSSDRTLEILRRIEIKRPEIKVSSIAEANIGKALRQGYLSATGKYLANASVDWYDVEFIKSSMPLLKKNDIVVGTKSRPGCDQRPIFRRVISHGYNFALKTLFGLKVTDTHSLIVYNRKKVANIIKLAVMGRSVFSSEVIIRAQYRNLRIIERDIIVHEERKRKKSIVLRTFKAFSDLIMLRIILWMENIKKI